MKLSPKVTKVITALSRVMLAWIFDNISEHFKSGLSKTLTAIDSFCYTTLTIQRTLLIDTVKYIQAIVV